jgi:hypothetical protein
MYLAFTGLVLLLLWMDLSLAPKGPRPFDARRRHLDGGMDLSGTCLLPWSCTHSHAVDTRPPLAVN